TLAHEAAAARTAGGCLTTSREGKSPLVSRALGVLAVTALLGAASGAQAGGGAVATEHRLAAAAGAEMLRVGGTVVDAALAEAPHLRREIERSQDLLRADAGLRAVFLGPDGASPPADFRIRQPDLASSLERLGRRGARALTHGSVAAAIADAVHARGGVLTAADLARYRPVWRRPLAGTFRGHRVVTFPPPGSGGVLLEMLGILAHDDLAA